MSAPARRDPASVLLFLVLVLFGASVLQRAWVTEDAFITFRSVDNLVNGHGLRWNVDERVQSFTHPLWMMLLVPIRLLTGELYHGTIALSVALTLLAVGVAVRRTGASAWSIATFGGLLLGSKAVTDFATSGLESPLTYLLCAWFWAEALRPDGGRPPRLALLAALLATNRHDAVLLVAPGLVLPALRAVRERAIGRFLLSFWPFALWEAFSLLYFGFLFPNTAWAKLSSGLPSEVIRYQGMLYLYDLLYWDPLSAVLLAVTALGAGWIALDAAGVLEDARGRTLLACGAGVALSVVYVVNVGGDFMSGRFFAPAVFQAAVLGMVAADTLGERLDPRAPRLALGIVGALALVFPRGDTFASGSTNIGGSASRIVDERLFWSATNNLVAQGREKGYQDNPASQNGAKAAVAAQSAPPGTHVTVTDKSVGMLGYFGGPEVYVIDPAGLTDPLIARLPIPSDDAYWRPGHYIRTVPQGYEYARQTGDTSRMDPDLAAWYTKLRIVTSGDLLSGERLATIVAFNLGQYDDLRDRFVRATWPSQAED